MGCSSNSKVLTLSVRKGNIDEIDHDISHQIVGADKITLIYDCKDCKEGEKIKLFGEQFVKNNKDKCKIIYDNNSYDLTDYFVLTKIPKSQTLKITLIGIKNITNISGIFSFNYKIMSAPDIHQWNTNQITDMSYAFNGCFKLKDFKGISKWNTENVTNMSQMFSNCEDSKELPNISKWKLGKVTN